MTEQRDPGAEAPKPHDWRPDRFMVIAAHPDDADFGPAATAAAWIDQGAVWPDAASVDAATALAASVLVQIGAVADAVTSAAPADGAFASHAWSAARDARVAAGFVDGESPALGAGGPSVLRAARIDLLQGRAQVAADRLRARVEPTCCLPASPKIPD